jgi:hypothetical protein
MNAGSGRRRDLFLYRSELFIEDDFVSGSTSSGTVGQLGWAVANGTTSYVAATDKDHPGILRRDTSAVSGTVASLSLNPSQFVIFGMASPVVVDMTWLVKLGQKDANTTVRVGLCNGPTSSTPGDGIYFETLDADTNWFGRNNPNGGAGVRVDSGIAAGTDWVTLRLIASATQTIFSVNGTEVVNANPQMVNVAWNPFLHIINSAAAAKTVDVDRFQMLMTGLSR